MNKEDFIKMYKNTKKEEIIEELFYKCTANYRLNNIIDELEKWAKENNVNARDIYGYEMEDTKVIYLEDFLDKLKELKEGK